MSKASSSAAVSSSANSSSAENSSPASSLGSSRQIQALHNNILLANEELDKCKDELRKEKAGSDKLRQKLEALEKRLAEAEVEHRCG